MAMGMAVKTTGKMKMQAAAMLLCLVVLAASPRAALGNCRDDCMNACYGWPIVCKLSCGSACYGEVGISTLSTSVESSAKTEAPPDASAAPAAAQEEGGGRVSVLRGLKPSSSSSSSPPAPGDREF